MEKSCRTSAWEASPRPLFYLVNNPKQPLDIRNYFKNKILKSDYQKLWKN